MAQDIETLTPDERTHYERARSKGTSHNIALICATKSPPKANAQSERWSRNRGIAADGRTVKGHYQGALADYPGDPTAFVTSPKAAHEVAAKKGLIVTDGPLNHDTSNQKERAQKYGRTG